MSDYVAYGVYEGEGRIEPVDIIKTDGMAKSRVYEESGYYIFEHTDDIDDQINDPILKLKIHPANLYDFYEMFEELMSLHSQRKCHWNSGLCDYEFKCNSCHWKP